MSSALAQVPSPGPSGTKVLRSWDEGPPLIRIEKLNHYFGEGEKRTHVLKNTDLEIMPGEIVIMTGPSGSGKTTLLTLIGALRTVQEGRLEVMGQDFSQMSADELVKVRRGIGFIFQAHNLFESLTALQNVMMAQQLQATGVRNGRERAIELLETLDLGHRLHYKPDQLSGGQRQRVAIARALVNRPRLVLADEPTAALDAESGRKVVDLLRKLAETDGCTCLIVTHDNRILDVADRIISLVDGRIKSNALAKENAEICEFLTRLELFAKLTPDALAKVAEKMGRERHSAGKIIFRQGEPGDKFYLIRRGSVDVIVDHGTHMERKLAQIGQGDFFGEVALMTGARRNATIIARENLEVYTLGVEDFKAAILESATFKEQIYKAYAQRQ